MPTSALHLNGNALLPVTFDLEASVLGRLLLHPEFYLELGNAFDVGVFALPQHRLVAMALANAHARGVGVSPDSVMREIKRYRDEHDAPCGDSGRSDVDTDLVAAVVAAVVQAAPRGIPIGFADVARDMATLAGAARLRSEATEIDAIATRDTRPDEQPDEQPEQQPASVRRVLWRRCRDDVDTILARADEPWVALRLGGNELITARNGATIILVGPTGRGKTSLALSLLVEHARDCGPAIAMSLELPADELTARAIGSRREASWRDVLTGGVPRAEMLGALPERLARIDRRDATLAALAAAVGELRALYPNEPILVAVDYVQLIGADATDDIRPRVGRVMRDIDALAREKRVVVLALSQGSRASSRALSSGERIGADTTDAGAESADLERWATVTLAIGSLGVASEDGTCAVELSIGKSRMGGGDRVLPARMCGRTGRWRLDGDARPADEVRAEKRQAGTDKATSTLALALPARLAKAPAPMSRREIRSALGAKDVHVRAAVESCLDDPETGVVEVGPRRGGAWLLWTRPRAEEARRPIVPRSSDGVST